MHFDMHLSDETTGHGPVEPTHEIDDTDLSDEALDRVPVREAYASCASKCTVGKPLR
jgi:hypothetical protein